MVSQISQRSKFKSSNPATGDEQFQNKLLEDFRYFCCNKDGRLLNFWKSCKDEYHATHIKS